MLKTHRHRDDPRVCPARLYVPSARDLHTTVVRAPASERIITPTRIYTIRYKDEKRPFNMIRAMRLEEGACSGRVKIGQWLRAVRRMGFVVRVRRR